MSRKIATTIDNKFINGLITDTTALNFPENACTDTYNCIFDYTGRITRRPGINFEESSPTGLRVDYALAENIFTEYVWETSEGTTKKSFVVVQHGDLIEFYDSTDTTVLGPEHKSSFSIRLSDHPLPIQYYIPAQYPCQYSTGNSKLIIVNKGINPLLISYDDNDGSISVDEITITFRDFEGVDDTLKIYERPTKSVATLKSDNPEHYYNLLNQGWHTSDALAQWDTAFTSMPSNSDQVSFFRASETDAFDSTRVAAYSSVLNTPAPKGHFILEVGNINRTTAMVSEGFTGAALSAESTLIPAATGSVIGNATGGANAFDGTTSQVAASSAAWAGVVDSNYTAYVGKDYGGSPQRIGFAKVYPSSDQGFVGSFAGWIRVFLYGSNTLPTNATNGILLGQFNSSDLLTEVTIGSNDSATAFRYVWVTVGFIDGHGTSYSCYVAEAEFYTSNNTVSYHRPQTTAFMAGRVWYAGIEDGALNNQIFYSRIILKDEDYGKCYQANDPTSEFLSEVLPDDGGVIRIIDAGRVLKLFPYQNSLVVFCSNGIWRISFSTATEYSVRKISQINLDSPASLINVKGIPIWWSDDGIYTVQYEANFDAFSVQSLSLGKIDAFITAIPRLNRKYVKGVYDANNRISYWLYSNTETLTDETAYNYNRVLVMDMTTQAFYPWSLNEHPDVIIRGFVFVQPASRSVDSSIKYILTVGDDGTAYTLFWGDILDTSYLDWYAYSSGNLDYDSYFLTGYKIHGDTQRFAQPNYIMVFLDTLEDSSCYVQGVFDFSNSGSSGKWSNTQQLYNENITFRNLNYRRLKIRGKGRAIQLKFTSETGKPFSIIGWSIMESQNSGV